jgi:hypothetical protein
MSKLIEQAVCTQITNHIESCGLNEPLQSAYRAFHSPETALVKVFDSILGRLDDGNAVFLTLLDLSAAFDTVDHRILLRRLRQSIKVDGAALAWFESYLTDRTVRVSVDGHYSDEATVDCSVPQGSILGPRQYFAYTTPLGTLVRVLSLLFHFFADDSQLWQKVNPRSLDDQLYAAKNMEHSIATVAKWMFHIKLQLNRDKTEFVVIASSLNHRRIRINHLDLEGDVIKASKTVRNLGVMMDHTLSMMDHINHVRKTGFYYLRWIRKVRYCLTESAAKTIVHALVISQIDYCNSLLVNLPDCAIDKLQKLMNAAARLITHTSRHQEITPVLKHLHWLPVRQRINFKIQCLTYKALNNEAPQYLRELLVDHTPTRNLRSSAAYSLVIPRRKVKYGERAFSYAAPFLWNKLPTHIKLSESTVLFKKKLKTHIFSEYYG